MKTIVKYFSLLIINIFAIFFFYNNPIKAANFDESKNYVSISFGNKDDDGNKKVIARVSITYQRGFGGVSQDNKSGTQYVVCKETEVSNNGYCLGVDWKPFLTEQNTYISQSEASYADSNLTTKHFEVDITSDIDTSNKMENTTKYVMLVQTCFCAVRNADNTACQVWYASSNSKSNYGVFKSNTFTVKEVLNTELGDIEDKGLKDMMDKVSVVIYNDVMPIIWIVLGMFLVIKGTILGVQIVKAADEPQVRQEKIGSLKWLVIGVAVAALASGAVTAITGYFSGVFN